MNAGYWEEVRAHVWAQAIKWSRGRESQAICEYFLDDPAGQEHLREWAPDAAEQKWSPRYCAWRIVTQLVSQRDQ